MAAGDRWKLPGGHEALEMPGSTRTVLRLSVIRSWPFPAPPVEVARDLCERMPSRYLQGQIPQDDAIV